MLRYVPSLQLLPCRRHGGHPGAKLPTPHAVLQFEGLARGIAVLGDGSGNGVSGKRERRIDQQRPGSGKRGWAGVSGGRPSRLDFGVGRLQRKQLVHHLRLEGRRDQSLALGFGFTFGCILKL